MKDDMTKFDQLGLAKPVLSAIAREKYTTPTPIQAKAIPVLMKGRDLVGIAQTGTGKTAAFVLPLLSRIAGERYVPTPKSATALILAPTRELAAQIVDSIRTYGRAMKPTTALIVGGVKPFSQVKAMRGGVDIIVATPGRLLDLIQTGDMHLNAVREIILDEADQMMDLGFMPAIRRIMAKLPKDRQTVLFSATMPKQIRALANDFLKNPAEVSVTPVATPVERIEQIVMHVDKAGKTRVLIDLLRGPDMGRVVVFTRTKHGADRVCRHLDKAGLQSAAIHGNKSQPQRQRALRDFKAGGVTILVATDIAARGIDIDGVTHVINYDLPNVPEAYVHRIGRTARAGKSGVAVALCDPSEKKLLNDIQRLTKVRLTPVGAPKREANTAPHQPQVEEQATRADEQPAKPRRAKKPHRKGQHGRPVETAAQDGQPRRSTSSASRTRPQTDGHPAAEPKHRGKHGDENPATGQASRRRANTGKPTSKGRPVQGTGKATGGSTKSSDGRKPGGKPRRTRGRPGSGKPHRQVHAAAQ